MKPSLKALLAALFALGLSEAQAQSPKQVNLGRAGAGNPTTLQIWDNTQWLDAISIDASGHILTLAGTLGQGLGLLEAFPGASPDAQLRDAISKGYTYVYMLRNESFSNTTPINFPANFVLDCRGHFIFQTANASPSLFNVGDQAGVEHCRPFGDGTHTGDMFAITTGNNQHFTDVDISNTVGYNLTFAANVGINFRWDGGSFNRSNPALYAVQMPASELATSGLRTFTNLAGNGSNFMDTAGSNVTIIEGLKTSCMAFGAASRYTLIHNSRLACAPSIFGTLHQIHGVIFDNPPTLGAGLTYTVIEAQPGLLPINSSGNRTNTVISAAGEPAAVYMQSDGAPGWSLNVGANERIELGTLPLGAASYMRGMNGIPLNFGITNTDYVQLAADGGLLSIGVTGGSKGSGSANFGALYVGGVAVIGGGITALTGDVLASGIGAVAATISGHAVTYSKFQQVAASSLVGNPTGSLADAQGITLGSTLAFSGSALQTAAMTGDITSSANSYATTLATVNANVGSFGSSTAIPVITANGKGLITALSTAAVVAPAGTLTGATLAAGVTASSLTSVGTIGTGTWQGSVIAGQYGGTGVANTGKTITLGGNLTMSGAFAATFTLSNTTSVTFPIGGTLASLSTAETFTAQQSFVMNGNPVVIDSSNSSQQIVMKAAGATSNFFGAAGGTFYVQNAGGTIQTQFQDDTSGGTVANQITFHGVATTNPVNMAATGTDTNIDMALTPKGTGVLKVGNASSFSANGAVATVLGSIGPTGSHTTVQKWLTIKDNGATVGYLPVF